MYKSLIFLLCLMLMTFIPTLAEEANIVSIDETQNTAIIEINGKQYRIDLSQPIQAGVSTTSSPEPEEDYAALEAEFAEMLAKDDKYTGLPTVVNTRLYTQPTDRLMAAGHFGVDFTHRFSGRIDDGTAHDLYGLDTFAYNSIGVHYGVTDWAEIRALRSNVGDMSEFAAKVRLLKETRKFSPLNPFNVTLNSGFQNDNLQNSLDPYIQMIVSRSIVPQRLQAYVSPIYAFQSNSIARTDSKSAIFFSFMDEDGRAPGDDDTFALPLGMSFEFIKNRASLVGEIVPVLYGFQENNMGWAVAVQVLSGKETHIWTVGVSNMPYVTTGQYVVGGPDGDLHLGFNVNLFL